MHKLIALVLSAGLIVPVVQAGARSSAPYEIAEDEDLRYAQVISSLPVFMQVRVSEVRRECGPEPRPYGDGEAPNAPLKSAATAALPYAGYAPVGYAQRCRTVTSVRSQQRIEGYDVTYRYRDRVYTTRMPYDPGSSVPVRHKVLPVRH
jgi:uncharacterized protein YcfJ